MTEKPGIWFVYRSDDEGPLAKRVRRLDASSVLAWFQAAIEEARVALKPGEAVTAALGGRVHGLEALFEAAREHSLHTPKTAVTLRKLLGDHLHVNEDQIFVDGHSVRVLTADKEHQRAYLFFDDEAVSRGPDRLSWLVLDQAKLPAGDADGGFSPPVETPAYTAPGDGPGATYACLLGLPGAVGVFPGVRLPGLAAHLKGGIPADASAPLQRLHAAIIAADVVPEGAHAVVIQGEQSWVLFDERWAAAHPDLAASILRYGKLWDPFANVKPAKGSKDASKGPSSTRGGPASAGKKPAQRAKASAAATAAANKHEAAWKGAVGGRAEGEARTYVPAQRYAEGELINHAKFGVGVVVRAEGTKIEAIFSGQPRVLVHGAQ